MCSLTFKDCECRIFPAAGFRKLWSVRSEHRKFKWRFACFKMRRKQGSAPNLFEGCQPRKPTRSTLWLSFVDTLSLTAGHARSARSRKPSLNVPGQRLGAADTFHQLPALVLDVLSERDHVNSRKLSLFSFFSLQPFVCRGSLFLATLSWNWLVFVRWFLEFACRKYVEFA